MSYLQDQAMAAAGYKKSSGKDQEAALDKALKSADYLASRGADGIAATSLISVRDASTAFCGADSNREPAG